MKIKPSRPILIIEDSPEDFEATVRAFKKSGLSNPIYHCEDGDDALDYLYQRGKYTDTEKSPRPGIVLLDLNLPGTDGREVLCEVKNDSDLRKIPVIVLTTSNDPKDIEHCYESGANSYICKPVNINGLIDSIQRLNDYWFEIVGLPKGEEEHGF